MSRVDSALLAHLDAERAWYDTATGHLAPLVQLLRSEMTARVPATDSSVSWRQHAHYYYTCLPAEREYVQLLRRRADAPSDHPPQVLLDVNDLADDSGYVELGLTQLSPDGRFLAWSVDRDGDEVYELRFRDLGSGQDLDEVIPRSYYGGAWGRESADATYFFYTVHDEAYRPHEVWRHALGTSPDEDVLVLEEPDERFELVVRGSRSGGLVIFWAESRSTREVWALDATDPLGTPRSVGGRRDEVEYHAEHVVHPDGTDELLVVTNDGATEFCLMRCPVPRDAGQDANAWSVARPEDPAERLEKVEAFATHVVLASRAEGHQRLRIVPLDDLGGEGIILDPAFPPGSVALAKNEEFDTDRVTVCDQSYVQPPVWSDVAFATGERTERHRTEAPGHDPSRYVGETVTFPAPDGTPVAATVWRCRDTPLDGTAPALLYAYGAYEWVDEPLWEPALPSLLDRGVVFAHPQIRGGGDGGRRWWLDGRMEAKQNTFTDHIAVADGLDGLVDGTRIATRGLSAGGLLQGVVFTQRPERWRAVVAEVPFVDVVTTMFDASIPLTITEWEEWGDPRKAEDFAWLLAYSPYDNIPPAGNRPDLLVTGAVHDPRVMVFEPAKWVAALRASDPEWSPRCHFRVETGAGAHAGPSGRFAHLAYEAEVYAWVLDRLGVT